MRLATLLVASWCVAASAFPIKAVVREHNIYRCMHGVPPLKWNRAIARKAQSWTQHTKGVMVHGGMDGFPRGRLGQNLVGLMPRFGYNEVRGVKMWYDEIKHSNHGRVANFGSGQTGHYTQVVWRHTREVGCGEYKRGTCDNAAHKCLMACDYFPAGNMAGAYAKNVNGPVKSRAQCARKVAMELVDFHEDMTSEAETFEPLLERLDSTLALFVVVLVGSGLLMLGIFFHRKTRRSVTGSDRYEAMDDAARST